ncbi:MAG TPA: hypothetical protein DCK99_19220 [Blastocatellia bacterium]|nr:hypothetical protein [Blastocatellia bacterium]
MTSRFLQTVDGFYLRPEKVRRRALAMTYSEPDGLVGRRTQAYQPGGIKELIEKKFRIRIGYWEDDVMAIEASNGVFFSAFARGRMAETVGVHYDDPPNWMMLLVYLAPRAPYNAGTSLWQHRETGLISNPTKQDAKRLGIRIEKLEAMLERDSKKPGCWIEIDRIGNVYNRAVLFPSGLLHSATKHFGSNQQNGRLYQSFHFSLRQRDKR